MADTPEKLILTDCPRCGKPPQIVVSPIQAFCGDDDCEVFCWDMTATKEEFEAEATYHCLTCGAHCTCGAVEPRSIAPDAVTRTGVYLGDRRDV